MLLFSPPTCASQCKLRRLRANARLSALLYSRSCERVAVTVVAVSTGRPVCASRQPWTYAEISKYIDSCKVNRDTYRVKSSDASMNRAKTSVHACRLYLRKDMDVLEKIQRGASGDWMDFLTEIYLTYEDHLKECDQFNNTKYETLTVKKKFLRY